MYQDLSDEEVQGCGLCGCRFLYSDLPQGYDAPVSELRFELFWTASASCLARTVASQPKILIWMKRQPILTETESLVQDSLAKMRKGRTTIAIAHRLSTIQDANCSLRFDKGIIESGTHEELLTWEEPITRCIACRQGLLPKEES